MEAGDPYGTRTRVFAVRGRRPRPLDEGAAKAGGSAHMGRAAALSSDAEGKGRPGGTGPFILRGSGPYSVGLSPASASPPSLLASVAVSPAGLSPAGAAASLPASPAGLSPSVVLPVSAAALASAALAAA